MIDMNVKHWLSRCSSILWRLQGNSHKIMFSYIETMINLVLEEDYDNDIDIL